MKMVDDEIIKMLQEKVAKGELPRFMLCLMQWKQ